MAVGRGEIDGRVHGMSLIVNSRSLIRFEREFEAGRLASTA